MVLELSSGTVAQWPDRLLLSNKHQRNVKFRQLDSLCTAAEETICSVNLNPALTVRPLLFAFTHTHLPLSF